MLGHTPKMGDLTFEIDVFPNLFTRNLWLGARQWVTSKALALGNSVNGVGGREEGHAHRGSAALIRNQTIVDIAHAEIPSTSGRSDWV